MLRFHELMLVDIRRETADSVSLAFAIPERLRSCFRFTPGQYLTLRADIGGCDVRRSYSICSGLNDGELRVAVRQVPGGAFSTYARETLAIGDVLQVFEPDGGFLAVPDPATGSSYVGFAAGSGITPVLSIVRSILEIERCSRFALFYGNRHSASVMFREALEDLKNRFPERFSLTHVMSRERHEIDLFNGRIDAAKCDLIFRSLIDLQAVDRFFLCGPDGMTTDVRASLLAYGVSASRISSEHFVPSSEAAAIALARREERRRRRVALPAEQQNTSEVTVILDGKSTTITVPRDGDAILDAALEARPELPFACKGGMCCTCRARLVEGAVEMDLNYTLAPEELERGFVLACQSHPQSDRVVLDFDFR